MDDKPNVWVVYNDGRRDYSKAERYGVLKDVFTHQVHDNSWGAALSHIRHLFQNYKDGDFILPVGSHLMTAAVTAVALENSEDQVLRFLSWDNRKFDYEVANVDFDYYDPSEDA